MEIRTDDCSLPDDERPGRLRDWREIAAASREHTALADGVRLVFDADPSLAARIAELATLETACCSSFDFTLRPGADRITLEARGPADVQPLITALLAPAS